MARGTSSRGGPATVTTFAWAPGKIQILGPFPFFCKLRGSAERISKPLFLPWVLSILPTSAL